jgi:enoyl-CoA hydratase
LAGAPKQLPADSGSVPVSVTIEDVGGVLVASIDDGKANALSFGLVESLRSVVKTAGDEGQPLVLTGRDGCFSAGFDLAVMNGDDQDRALALFAEGARLYRETVEAPVPVVASCTGHALAGGAILLLCADYRIGRTGPYRLGLNEVGIGMALPAFAVSIATHRLEPRHLTSATMFAEVSTPDRALAMGFLDEVADDPLPGAINHATALMALPHEAFATTKRRIRRGLSEELAVLEGR